MPDGRQLFRGLAFLGQPCSLGIALGTLFCRPQGLLFLNDPLLSGRVGGLLGPYSFRRPFGRLGVSSTTLLCLLRQLTFTFRTPAFGFDPGCGRLLGLACLAQCKLFDRLALLRRCRGLRLDGAALGISLRLFGLLLRTSRGGVQGGTLGLQAGCVLSDGLLFLNDPFLSGRVGGLLGPYSFRCPFGRLGVSSTAFLCLLRQLTFTFRPPAFGFDPGSRGLLGLPCRCQRLLFGCLELLCRHHGLRLDGAALGIPLRLFGLLLRTSRGGVQGGTLGLQTGCVLGDNLLFGIPPRRQHA